MYGFSWLSDYVSYSKIKSKQHTRAIQQGSSSLFWPVTRVQKIFFSKFRRFFEKFWIFLNFFFYPPTINWMVLLGWNTEKNSGQSQIGVTELKNGCFYGVFLPFFDHFLLLWWHLPYRRFQWYRVSEVIFSCFRRLNYFMDLLELARTHRRKTIPYHSKVTFSLRFLMNTANFE